MSNHHLPTFNEIEVSMISFQLMTVEREKIKNSRSFVCVCACSRSFVCVRVQPWHLDTPLFLGDIADHGESPIKYDSIIRKPGSHQINSHIYCRNSKLQLHLTPSDARFEESGGFRPPDKGGLPA